MLMLTPISPARKERFIELQKETAAEGSEFVFAMLDGFGMG